MALDKDLIDKLLGDYQKPEDLIGENGLLKQLTKALVERALNAELTHHLGYEKNDAEGRGSGNSRNGTSRKKLTGDFGKVEIEMPRDREGTSSRRSLANIRDDSRSSTTRFCPCTHEGRALERSRGTC